MVEVNEEVLFDALGSVVEALTVAVFVERVLELNTAAFTLMVITTVLPTLKLPMLQETVVVTAEYVEVPAVVCEELYVTCAGIGSVTTTLCATAGPPFLTMRVYERFVP